ncbi:phosphate ABC transporter substrate-binding protein, PhoT family [Singulisphaera sp. GP187]|uniref:PstS family phosphate ABC transporter substrate-binding protein n=1 Tax=Singulisphaera sp. GP187 TaxID=1882752 RepID=UPI0009288F78|nr:PstS family phosphate ABC transporter substrate-binding protein [Singulisphaera sp. GP187]SIN87729.1 phosphate ABC transporter substrate-binding protein, PhoT family [Singulisphaera sp. GP187]
MRHARSARLAATLIATILVGCGGDGGSPSGASSTVDIDGSSTVFRISEAAREAYSAVEPNVTVVVDNHGTGGGFSNYLNGEIDIVDASRLAKPDEEAKAKAQGIPWTRFVVGTDGITVVVNPDNQFVKSLTVAQLKAIWEPGSKVMTWKDVDPTWPDRKIVLYSPDSDSGTFEYFTEAIVGKAKQQRDDVQPSSDDNTLVNGVAGDADGIGYFGHAYFEANADKLRAIPIQNGADAAPILPSEATILDQSYKPLSRPLFIYVKNSSIRRPAVLGFLKYYLEHIEALAKKGGYVPPTAEEREANQKAIKAGGDASAPTSKDAA